MTCFQSGGDHLPLGGLGLLSSTMWATVSSCYWDSFSLGCFFLSYSIWFSLSLTSCLLLISSFFIFLSWSLESYCVISRLLYSFRIISSFLLIFSVSSISSSSLYSSSSKLSFYNYCLMKYCNFLVPNLKIFSSISPIKSFNQFSESFSFLLKFFYSLSSSYFIEELVFYSWFASIKIFIFQLSCQSNLEDRFQQQLSTVWQAFFQHSDFQSCQSFLSFNFCASIFRNRTILSGFMHSYLP